MPLFSQSINQILKNNTMKYAIKNNNTDRYLGANIWTFDIERALHFATRKDAKEKSQHLYQKVKIVPIHNKVISPDNKLTNILDFDICKKMFEDAVKNGENYIILCPHYSINIASKYEDCEGLQFDLDELSEYIGSFVEVNDYDDLVINLNDAD